MNSVSIFTDGSSRPKTLGDAGYCYSLKFKDRTHVFYGTIEKGTNNQAEMMGVLQALKRFSPTPNVTITFYSDSQLVVKGINEWMQGWKRRNWRKADGKPVLNVELWRRMFDLWMSRTDVTIKWVKGHSGNEMNDIADEYANCGSDCINVMNESTSTKIITYEGVVCI